MSTANRFDILLGLDNKKQGNKKLTPEQRAKRTEKNRLKKARQRKRKRMQREHVGGEAQQDNSAQEDGNVKKTSPVVLQQRAAKEKRMKKQAISDDIKNDVSLMEEGVEGQDERDYMHDKAAAPVQAQFNYARMVNANAGMFGGFVWFWIKFDLVYLRLLKI